MPQGYNHRCVKASEKAVQKAKITKKDIEDMEADKSESQYLDMMARNERSAMTEW